MSQRALFDVPETRHFAYESVDTNEGERIVIEQLRRHGELTADEIAEKAGRDVLSIRPRVSALKKMRVIEDTGIRRPNASKRSAAVWRLVEVS